MLDILLTPVGASDQTLLPTQPTKDLPGGGDGSDPIAGGDDGSDPSYPDDHAKQGLRPTPSDPVPSDPTEGGAPPGSQSQSQSQSQSRLGFRGVLCGDPRLLRYALVQIYLWSAISLSYYG